ncbi:hypothetical protein L596_019191 [Steinernema carpocapsae]|uniref:Uncharacterized protein n=1 Tax=Steinernema carpocapsae TaxID=34508 RepID=A0A4U5MQ79_STECR|nr:hypothetical protein L596_019191 [Steinernema carpocapsae]
MFPSLKSLILLTSFFALTSGFFIFHQPMYADDMGKMTSSQIADEQLSLKCLLSPNLPFLYVDNQGAKLKRLNSEDC